MGEILTAAYAPSGLTRSDPYWTALRDVAGRARAAEVWVAADPAGIAGTVTWAPPGSPEREIAVSDEAEFRMLAVDPEGQHRGTGRALVQAVIDRAAADGFGSVVLSSAPWMTAAHQLYERLGFVRTPARDWRPRPDLTLRTYRLAL